MRTWGVGGTKKAKILRTYYVHSPQLKIAKRLDFFSKIPSVYSRILEVLFEIDMSLLNFFLSFEAFSAERNRHKNFNFENKNNWFQLANS